MSIEITKRAAWFTVFALSGAFWVGFGMIIWAALG